MVGEDETFNVIMFFPDGSYNVERTGLGAEEAVKVAFGCTRRVAVHLGIIQRVIITDQNDLTCFEWKHGEGVTYPKREQVMFGDT
jgi:hypothetical protein